MNYLNKPMTVENVLDWAGKAFNRGDFLPSPKWAARDFGVHVEYAQERLEAIYKRQREKYAKANNENRQP